MSTSIVVPKVGDRQHGPRGPTRRTLALKASLEAKRREPALTTWVDKACEAVQKQLAAHAYVGEPNADRLLDMARWLQRGAGRQLAARPDYDAIDRAMVGLVILNAPTEVPIFALIEAFDAGEFPETRRAAAAAAARWPRPEYSAAVWAQRIAFETAREHESSAAEPEQRADVIAPERQGDERG